MNIQSKNTIKFLCIVFIFSLTACSFEKSEIINFRGENRQGIYDQNGLLKEWSENKPELVLKIEGIGKGFSSPVVHEEVIYVSGMKDDSVDVVSAFEINGHLIWDKIYGKSWNGSYRDTRSTPTIEKNRMYLSSGMGEVVCINIENGDIIWKKNVHSDFNGKVRHWGNAESILLTDKDAIYIVGGEETSVVALNKTDGSVSWKTESMGGEKSYSSPVLIERDGKQIILALTDNYLMGINPENGKLYWKYEMTKHFKGSFGKGAYTNSPLYYNGDIFVTSGYNHPGIMLSLADNGNSVQFKWRNDTIDTHHGGVVLVNGNIYGSNWQNNAKGKWASVNWETG